ncbi:FAD-dependent monooxygenase [Glutamicibacter sp. FR1]|uniref:FAD-dependent monooxygenase n=1 Tax=Glutamicibacter sp. FR1 TaxID=3393744 RepID=UPI0039B0E0FE
MKAIIIGAGIAGLVAARQLGLAGWNVLVLERSAAPRPDGYMMDFFGPGIEASERIGLYPYLAQAAHRVQAAQYVDRRGKPTASLDYSKFSDLAGGKVLTLLRPDMEAAAREALKEVDASRLDLRYGVDIDRLEVRGQQVHVGIKGQSQPEVGDLLVGADGIHSAVRARFFGPETEVLRPLGMRAAAFIVRDPELNRQYKNRFVLTDTVDRTAGIYGLRSDEVASFLVYRHEHGAPLGSARDRLRSIFAGCGAQVDRLLMQCPEDPYDDAVAQVVMDSWHAGPVVLIGDAAAAVSLLAGQGGAMAVCAAAALGDAVGGVTDPGQLKPALARYEQAMRPKIATAQASGRRAANSFLPRNQLGLWIRRIIVNSTHLPGMDRLVARQIVKRLAK